VPVIIKRAAKNSEVVMR